MQIESTLHPGPRWYGVSRGLVYETAISTETVHLMDVLSRKTRCRSSLTKFAPFTDFAGTLEPFCSAELCACLGCKTVTRMRTLPETGRGRRGSCPPPRDHCTSFSQCSWRTVCWCFPSRSHRHGKAHPHRPQSRDSGLALGPYVSLHRSSIVGCCV